MSRSSHHHHHHHHPKLKAPLRPLFSCGIFRNCTQSDLSPTTPPTTVSTFLQQPSPPPSTPPPPPQPVTSENPPPSKKTDPTAPSTSSSSSSSSSTSQSFTQWRFPLHHHHPPEPEPGPPAPDAVTPSVNLAEAFHAAEVHFSSGARLPALRHLERSLSPDPSPAGGSCPSGVMAGVVASLRDPASARAAAKVLLALLLAESNRRVAVEAGAVSAALEAVVESGPSGATAERALAALELMCTVDDGAEEVRGNALSSAALAGAVEGMVGRGRECAIGVMAAIYGGDRLAEAPPEVARAVVVAMQGECSARGRRKGAQLLRALQESGRLDPGGVGC